MEFKYPPLIYFDITDNDSDISLEQARGQQEYTMRDRGSSGVVYVNVTLTNCIKLILYPPGISDDDIKPQYTQRYENEVRLQHISNDNGFAPAIHRNFGTQITINGMDYNVYVIVMDYLDPAQWRNMKPIEITNDIIQTFVTKTGLYNDVDPYNHFYQTTNGKGTRQIVMIDYGHVKECKTQKPKLTIDQCSKIMFSKFKSGGSKLKKNRHKSKKGKNTYSLRKKKRTLKYKL
jgi:hypothetical protein